MTHAKIVCLRLQTETIRELEAMARVDGKDMEERLSEIVEELVRRGGDAMLFQLPF